MIKVMHLIDGGFIGGGQMHALALCQNLPKEKYLSVVCASPKGDFKDMVLESGFEFIDINLPKMFRTKYLAELLRKVERENINIIHAHGGVAGMYARYLKKKYECRAKVVHTLHGIHYIHSRNIIRKYSSLYIEQYLSSYSDAYICVSKSDFETASSLRIVDQSRTFVINNGINLSRFKNISRSESLEEKFGISSDNFVIGNISRFDEQKNQKLLIKVMPDVLKAIPEAKLLLVGDGHLLDSAKHLAKSLGVENCIMFTGARQDLEKIFPMIDIFVLPSLWEGLSLTLLEAFASGKCIIASNIPSNSEVINEGENGLLFNLHNSSELSDLIVDLFNDREKRNYLSINAQKSSEIYDEKIMTKQTEKVYESILSNTNK